MHVPFPQDFPRPCHLSCDLDFFTSGRKHKHSYIVTVFENHIQLCICEQSELRLYFEWTKVHEKCQKWAEACGQTVLPDRSLLIRQKLVGRAKIGKFKCDVLSNFQTLC